MTTLSKVTHLPQRLTIAREGAPAVFVIFIIAIALWLGVLVTNYRILLWGAMLLTIVAGTIAFLFRDPDRTISKLTNLDILSPADGKIISIGPASEPEFLKQEAIRVSIFLSLFDVHVNRIPVSGVVKFKRRSEGRCLPAYFESASNDNRSVAVGIECDDGFCMTMVQITGFFARRIKCHLDLNQNVDRGSRYGMICFGSRVDIFLPRDTKIKVQKGDHVYGGITVIGQKDISHVQDKISHP